MSQESTNKTVSRDTVNRIPPHNEDAEISVLGSILLDKDSIVKIADFLRPADFYIPAHTLIFEAMLDLYEQRDPIDVLSLTNKLKERNQLQEVGGEAKIASLAGAVPTAGNVEHYGRIVQRKSTLRRLISAASEINALGFKEDAQVDEILDEAEQKLFGVSQQHLRQLFIPVKSVLTEAFHRIDLLHKGDGSLRGLPSGFPSLDNILSGFQKSDLVILAARPSVGKTAFALDVARAVAVRQKQPVGIFSIEMSKEQLADRLICAEAGVDLWKMRMGKLSSDDFPEDDFSRINKSMAVLAEAPIYIDDSATSNVMEMRTLARRLQAEHGIGFLVIDYLQLMEGDAREGRVQEVSQISRALKNLARELNIPVMALSQLSRAVESRTPPIPKLSDLRESGCLTGDTLITRADTGERVPISELAEHEEKPIPVFSLDDQYRLVPKPLIKAFKSGRKRVYKITTRSGRTIKASANHPFRKLEGWFHLDQLQKKDRIATHAKSDLFWDEIIEITDLGVQDVYDATVPETHNFVANDIVVHNSIEQDADVVLFLYPRGKHENDAENPNITDAIVAKHRNGPTGAVSLYFHEESVSFSPLDTQHDEKEWAETPVTEQEQQKAD